MQRGSADADDDEDGKDIRQQNYDNKGTDSKGKNVMHT